MDAHKKTKPYRKTIHTKIVNSAYLWAMKLKVFIFSVSKLCFLIFHNENILFALVKRKITFKYASHLV